MSRAQAVAQLVAPAAPVPVVWTLLGYQFEAAPMIVALCACLAVRLYLSLQAERHPWRIDLIVTFIALMATMVVVGRIRPDPFYAFAFGGGLGAMGVGIISLVTIFARKQMTVLGLSGEDAPDAKP